MTHYGFVVVKYKGDVCGVNYGNWWVKDGRNEGGWGIRVRGKARTRVNLIKLFHMKVSRHSLSNFSTWGASQRLLKDVKCRKIGGKFLNTEL